MGLVNVMSTWVHLEHANDSILYVICSAYVKDLLPVDGDVEILASFRCIRLDLIEDSG